MKILLFSNELGFFYYIMEILNPSKHVNIDIFMKFQCYDTHNRFSTNVTSIP